MDAVDTIKIDQSAACKHCGLEFVPRNPDDAFCCSGCEYVSKLIHDENLDNFYSLQESQSAPVGYGVFTKKDFNWLQALARDAELKNAREPTLRLGLSGISCIGCVWLIEQLFCKQDGAIRCRIDVHRGEVGLRWQAGAFDIVAFANKLHQFGYELSETSERQFSDSRSLIWRLALCGAFALNGMLYTFPSYLGMEADFLFAPHFNGLSAAFATMSMLVGGSYFIRKALVAARMGLVHMDLPISIGLVVAYLASLFAYFTQAGHSLLYFDFIATFVFLMLCGKWLQIFAIERNRNRLASIEVSPPIVTKLDRKNCILNFDTRDMKADDRYLLQPGQWVAVESTLVSEKACQGMDWINGEPEPRLYGKGSRIPSGSINRGSVDIELVATESWENSLLRKLLDSSQDQSEEDPVMQKWIQGYLLAVIAIASLGAAAWVSIGSIEKAVVVFVSALVVSCPCALGIAIPLTNELASSRLRLRGVFLRTHSLWNRISRIKQIVFDKTGTLTRSTLEWTNPEAIKDLDTESISALQSISLASSHPITTTIRENLLANRIHHEPGAWKTQESIGQGVETSNGVHTWRFGKSDWAGGGDGEATVLSQDGKILAAFQFDDRPWSDAVQEIDALKQKGFTVSLLSGDPIKKVKTAASRLGIAASRAIGSASPEAKAEWLRQNNGSQSLILGDGANDSLAFDEALCSGTPAAEKTTLAGKADFYYLGAGIQGIRSLLTVATQRKQTMTSPLAFAIAYNLVAISLALTGIVTPLLAAILMPLSSIASLAIAWIGLRG